MITVTRGRAVVVGLAVAAGCAGLAGCGSNAVSTPTASNAPTLPAPPASVAPDYTSLSAILAPLKGVAQCTNNGPDSAVCSLYVTTSNAEQISIIRPFQVKVFRTPQATSAYVTLVQRTNDTRASTDSASRAVLTGPHWVVVPQTTTADLLPTVKEYLGGTILQ